MTKLTMDSTIKSAKYGNKMISELVDEKGVIFSMIKDGYDFDDEVLEAAHIHKQIRDVRVFNRVGGDKSQSTLEKLPKETSSIRQIISELNTIDNVKYKVEDNNDDWSDANNFNNIDDDE